MSKVEMRQALSAMSIKSIDNYAIMFKLIIRMCNRYNIVTYQIADIKLTYCAKEVTQRIQHSVDVHGKNDRVKTDYEGSQKSDISSG